MIKLGRYVLLEKIGQGGMAEVFAARLEGPQQFARECVIKRLRPELAQMPQQVRLFLEEARLSAMLLHPCVVQVFDVGEAPREGPHGAAMAPDVFFAMERVDGPPLSRLLDVLRAAREPMPLEVCAWIGARVAEGLHFAHELVDRSTTSAGLAAPPKRLHIVHRDVSPQNVLLGSGGEVKVADFGIAKAEVEHRPQTRAGVTKGKLAYMSPEQARGEKVDRRTDVYALGVVLWEMLAGRPLFEDLADRRRQEAMRRSPKAPPPSEFRPEVDEQLDAIVAAALAPAAKDRTSDCRAIEDAFEEWLLEHEGSGARVELQRLLIDHAEALARIDETSGTRPHGVDVRALRAPAERPESSLPTRRPVIPSAEAGDDGGAPMDDDATTRPRGVPSPFVRADAPTLVKKIPVADEDEQTRPMGDAIIDGPAAKPPPTPVLQPKRAVAVKVSGRGAVPLPSANESGARLPSPPTSFVGRSAELERIGALFDDGARLLTLLGPGGTGKTRLALRFAEVSSSRGAFPGGVWFADLTGAADDATAQAAVARALGVSLRAGRTTLEAQAMLGHALAALGRTLVVVDNCDALAARGPSSGVGATGANVLADLSRRAPRTRFLVTSEQILRVPGERVLEVAPLLDNNWSDAVELFLDRARAARNGRALSDAARGVVEDIVRRLDGVPLAIELAAARAATETPAEILGRLGKRNDRGDAAGRGGAQSLQGAIGETWAQLGDDERRAFRQCSVFRGGFDVAAADAILELGDDEPRAVDVLERLKGRSLVVSRPSAFGARWSMLEALRAFANDRLEEAGERITTEARHAGFYVAMGKKLAQSLGDNARNRGEGTHAENALEVLATESANLSAVVERASLLARPSTAVAKLALEAALALEPMLGLRASVAEQVGVLDKALTVAEGRDVDEALLLRAHLARGEARRLLGSVDQARADLQQAIDLAVALNDKSAEGRALAGLGALALGQGKLELADETLAQALALAEEVRDDVTSGRVLAQLGKVSRMRRRLDEAEARTRRAVELSRGAGDARSAGRALVELASVLLAKRMLDDAALSASAATQILDALHDRRSLVHAWGTLAIIELDRHRWDEADVAAARAVDLAAHVGERRANGMYLGIRACALHASGDLIEARELYAQAVKTLFDVGEDGHGAFFSAGLGAVHAALDDVTAAAQAFATAERRLRGAERPLLQRATNLLEGTLLLARAGDEGARAEARAEVRRRLDSARVIGFEQSEEVRYAIHLVDEAAKR